MMEFWKIKCKLKYHFSREERAAIKGKLLMTEELFWKCLDTCWKRFDMEMFWDLWNQYPIYIEAMKAQCRMKEETPYWTELRNRLNERMKMVKGE